MKLSKEHIERLREMLARPGQRIVVVSHTNPDGDAVGSSLAWAEVLRTMGHAVTCVVPNKYPYFLDWMPGIDEVVIFKTDTEGRARRAIAEADMIFCLDFNAVSRLEILSDTIEQFAKPLMEKLGWPTIFCNSLEVAESGEITGFRMRCQQSKLTTVKALQSIGYDTIASGDSYNDLGMIQASKAGFLFKSTEQIKKDHPELPAYEEFEDLLNAIKAAL